MAANPQLDLPTAPRTSVFRAMEQIVRINPIFQRIIAPDRFRTWQGESRDEKPFTYQEAPCLRWTPTQQTEQFRTPTQISGWMTIQCEMITKGYCVDDQTNLWWLLTRCFYPGEPNNNTIARTLINAGARSGLVFFNQPSFAFPADFYCDGLGVMSIEVRSELT